MILGLGAVVLFILLVLAFRGASFGALFDIHALVLVGGGSFAASMFAYKGAFVRFMQGFVMATTRDEIDPELVAASVIKGADRVRTSGRQAAMGGPRDADDPFIKTGLSYIADGLEPQQIRALLETELLSMKQRHRATISLFEGLGGFSPVFGILGTVEAMIAILGNLQSPDKLGPEIALAMVATLYGVAFANLLFIPISVRLRHLSEEELRVKQAAVEVLVAIQEGAKPEYVREAVRSSLPPASRAKIAATAQRRARKRAASAPIEQAPMDENYGEEQYGDPQEDLY